jgi:hypothetical protein
MLAVPRDITMPYDTPADELSAVVNLARCLGDRFITPWCMDDPVTEAPTSEPEPAIPARTDLRALDVEDKMVFSTPSVQDVAPEYYLG